MPNPDAILALRQAIINVLVVMGEIEEVEDAARRTELEDEMGRIADAFLEALNVEITEAEIDNETAVINFTVSVPAF
jgi:hypothetical protein